MAEKPKQLFLEDFKSGQKYSSLPRLAYIGGDLIPPASHLVRVTGAAGGDGQFFLSKRPA